jgi:hypothetical protein
MNRMCAIDSLKELNYCDYYVIHLVIRSIDRPCINSRCPHRPQSSISRPAQWPHHPKDSSLEVTSKSPCIVPNVANDIDHGPTQTGLPRTTASGAAPHTPALTFSQTTQSGSTEIWTSPPSAEQGLPPSARRTTYPGIYLTPTGSSWTSPVRMGKCTLSSLKTGYYPNSLMGVSRVRLAGSMSSGRRRGQL